MSYILGHFLLLILSGYILVSWSVFYKYQSYQDNGYTLVFRALAVGIFVHLVVNTFISYIPSLYEANSEAVSEKLAFLSILNNELKALLSDGDEFNKKVYYTFLCVVIIYLLVDVVLLFFLPNINKAMQIYVSVKNGGQIEELLAKELIKDFENKEIMQIVLSENRVYFGFIMALGFNPKAMNYDFMIYPISRGYRDEKSKLYNESERFEDSNLKMESGVILKISDVLSISCVDTEIDQNVSNKSESDLDILKTKLIDDAKELKENYNTLTIIKSSIKKELEDIIK